MPQFNTFNVVKQENASSPTLVFASSIGSSSSDGPGISVRTFTGLWEEPTMKRPRGSVNVKLYMDKEPDDGTEKLTPNTYRIAAGYVCYKWAEKISMTDAVSLDGINERLDDVVLSNNCVPLFWAVFSVQSLGHVFRFQVEGFRLFMNLGSFCTLRG